MVSCATKCVLGRDFLIPIWWVSWSRKFHYDYFDPQCWENLSRVDDYRHISCWNVQYKCISKILLIDSMAARMKLLTLDSFYLFFIIILTLTLSRGWVSLKKSCLLMSWWGVFAENLGAVKLIQKLNRFISDCKFSKP